MKEGNFPDNMGKHCPYCQQNIEESLFEEHLHKHKVENNEINNNRPPLSSSNNQPPKISSNQVPIPPNFHAPNIPYIYPPIPIINNNNYFYPPPIVYPPNYLSQNNNSNNEVHMNNDVNNNQFVPPLYPYFRIGNSGLRYPYPLPQPMPYNYTPPKIVRGIPPEVVEKLKKSWLSINEKEIEEIMNILPTKTLTTLTEKVLEVQKNCIICLNDYEIGDIISTLPCFHIYHSSCIKDWFKSRDFCPVCKYEVSLKKLREGDENLIKD